MIQSAIAAALVLQTAIATTPVTGHALSSPATLSLAFHVSDLPLAPQTGVAASKPTRSGRRKFVGGAIGMVGGAVIGSIVGVKVGGRQSNDGDLKGFAIGLPLGAVAGALVGVYLAGR